MNSNIGISAIGIAVPNFYMNLSELSEAHGKDKDYYTKHLGTNKMALCFNDENVITLASKAINKALSYWDGDIKNIGLFAAATESATDHARPITGWIADEINLKGAYRSYEVKNACNAGSIAIKQAVEWLYTNDDGKAALVVATDICLYEINSKGEPTQGAGAIAFIITRNPTLAKISTKSFSYTDNITDFYRPIEAKFPIVQSRKSIMAYTNLLLKCYQNLHEDIDTYDALCMHMPCPQMAISSFRMVAKNIGMQSSEKIIRDKIAPYCNWNSQIGNSYTASLWINIACAINAGANNILAYSYGSGCAAEMISLSNKNNPNTYWAKEIIKDLDSRKPLNYSDYIKLRAIDA